MNAKLVMVKGCPELDEFKLKLIAKYVQYSLEQLDLEDKKIVIRLVGSNPKEPITTGAYNPRNKTITSIAGGRHLIDFCRTISHELTHMKQDYDGSLEDSHPEIGGPIEDEANIMSGRITKHFIKNILTDDEKKKLGLGSYK